MARKRNKKNRTPPPSGKTGQAQGETAGPGPQAATTSTSNASRPRKRFVQDLRLYAIHALSPVHIGVGESTGDINLPIAREVHTLYPFIPGSSLKGILRDAAAQMGLTHKQIYAAFGPPKERASDARGGLVISDSTLLFLPVRAMVGTFAWVTCPNLLRRLRRDLEHLEGEDTSHLDALLGVCTRENPLVLVAESSALKSREEGKTHIYLEDACLPFEGKMARPEVNRFGTWLAQWLWPDDGTQLTLFVDRVAVVSDDVFGYLHRYSTELRSRVKIDPATGTAADSGPWVEEYLPAETVLYGVVIGRTTQYVDRDGEGAADNGDQGKAAEPEKISPADVLGTLETMLAGTPLLRVGGKSTGGSGRVHVRLRPRGGA